MNLADSDFWRLAPWTVIWVDPGKITGLAWLTRYPGPSPDPVYGYCEDDFRDTCHHVEHLLTRHANPRSVMLGWEDYRLGRKQGQVMTEAPWSLEMIGVMRWFGTRYGVHTDSAEAGARSMVTRPLLREMGWLPAPGMKDAFAATQHLVAFLMRQQAVPESQRETVLRYVRRVC